MDLLGNRELTDPERIEHFLAEVRDDVRARRALAAQ
jgi:hypothetical protein